MSAVLLDRVAQVQATARRLVCVDAAARFAAAATVGTIAFAAVDYALRIDDSLFRWLLFVLYWAFIAGRFLRFLLSALRIPNDLLATARQIELRMPALGDRLSSAVAFAQHSGMDAFAGSRDLRTAAIEQARAIAASLDLGSVINGQAARRSIAVAAVCLVCAVAMASCNPTAALLAFSRLSAPWRSTAWPRRHELVFSSPPARIAAGDDFEAVLVDRRGALPSEVEIDIRRPGVPGAPVETRIISTAANQAVFRLENVTQSFEYRARGGDDNTMPWLPLNVVQRPKITDLKVIVRPPPYTGLPEKIEASTVTSIAGSQIEVHGNTDRPIDAVRLTSASTDAPPPVAELAADRHHFRVPQSGASPWIIHRSQTFGLELTDEHGLTVESDARIDVHAVEDQPPNIAWLAPSEHTVVTPGALVPIKCAVNDDLAVRHVELRFLRPGKADDEQVIDLLKPQLAAADRAELNPGVTQRNEYRLTFQWDLSQVADLSSGDVLLVRITAEDYKPQLATTAARRITVVTPAEFQERVGVRQSAILIQLEQALGAARRASDQTQNLESRVRSSASVSRPDISAVETIQYSLVQVRRLLDSGPDGAAGQAAMLLDELTANRATDTAGAALLQQLHDQLLVLNEHDLPGIDHELSAALKDVRQAIDQLDSQSRGATQTSAVAGVADRLKSAGQVENRLVETLERLVGSMSQSDAFNRIASQLRQMRAAQERLAGDTDELYFKSIGQSRQPSAGDRALVQQLQGQQLDLAREFDKLQAGLQAASAGATFEAPAGTQPIADAATAAGRLAIGSRMREAAAHLSQLRFSRASEAEQQVLQAIDELLNSFATQDSGKTSSKSTRQADDASSATEPRSSPAGAKPTPSGARSDANAVEKSATPTAESAAAEQALRRVWGHLPDKLREQLQAAGGEQFLPKYERLIEQFYQRLAEEPASKP